MGGGAAARIGVPDRRPANDPARRVHGQYHNRNRMYSPALGRFLSRDPNALGTPVLSDLSYAGMTLDASDVAPDLTAHYADGLNTHAAYGGNPLLRRDPSGLYINPADVAGVAVMGVVRGLRGGLEGMLSSYGGNMDYDVEWALDWDSGDDWHTRNDNSWVERSWNDGVRGGIQEWLQEDVKGLVDPLGIANDGSFDSQSGVAAVAKRFNGGPIRNVASILHQGRRWAGKFALHHALPLYLAKWTGRSSPILVKIHQHLHDAYHKWVSRGMTSAIGTPLMNARHIEWVAYFKWMGSRGYPPHVVNQRIIQNLRDLTLGFERRHGLSGLLDNLDDALRP